MERESGQAETDYLHELQHHYDLALKGLQDFIHENNRNVSEQGAFDGNIQILACMIQLISFEVSFPALHVTPPSRITTKSLTQHQSSSTVVKAIGKSISEQHRNSY